MQNNNCNIGDAVTLNVGGNEYKFVISGVSEINTYYDKGTVAVVLTDEQAKQFEIDGIIYSAAYVNAEDYEKCKAYLFSDYKPYGRLKDSSVFDNPETYDQHVKNFNDADWTKEITVCKDNYSSKSIKYENVENGILRNTIIASVIIALAVIILNSVLLGSSELKSFIQGFLIKKSGTKSKVKSFYVSGIIFNSVIFSIVTAALYYFIASTATIKLVSNQVLTSAVMIAAQIVVSIIMIAISAGVVEKKYTVNK